MSLFRFELRKLLFNRKTLIILGIMLVLYAAIGFGTTYFLVGSGPNYDTYAGMAEPLEGPVNPEKAVEAQATYEAVKERYGNNVDAIYYATSGDPVLKFDVDYAIYTEKVDEYYHGALTDNLGDPYGTDVLQSKLDEMEQDGQSGSFEYRKTVDQLEKERGLGEPEFSNTVLWGNLFTNWGDFIMMILLFVPLAFIISPVFSVEATTGMDNLILSSKHGRRKIVTAKIGSVVVTALIVVGIYLISTFAAGFLAVSTLDGWASAIRSTAQYVRAPFAMLNWQFALLTAGWLLLSGVVYALIVAFLSSRIKSQVGTFGVALIILFLNVAVSALGTSISSMLHTVTDFGIASISLVGEVFVGYKVFNVFGLIVPYHVMVLGFMAIVLVLATFGMHWSQRRRTVA